MLHFQSKRAYINTTTNEGTTTMNAKVTTMTETAPVTETVAAPATQDLFADLIEQQTALQKRIAEASQAKKAAIKADIATLAKALNINEKSLLAELFEDALRAPVATVADTVAAAAPAAKAAKPAGEKKTAVHKFRNPDDITLTGAWRGIAPEWFKALVAAWQVKNPALSADDVKEACKTLQDWCLANPDADEAAITARATEIRLQYTEPATA